MRHIGFIACIAIVASLFVLVIGLGYEINEGTPLGSVSAPAGGALILSVGVLVWHLGRQRGDPIPLWGTPLFRPRVKLPKPPDLRPEQEAYAADPLRLATCHHLQPVEGAMRRAGIKVKLRYGAVVEADCTIDESRLVLAAPAVYLGHLLGDRPGDPEWAMISCAEHGSVIGVVHPLDARPGTPAFPPSDGDRTG